MEGIEIVECLTDADAERVWPVMFQLREHLTQEEFLARLAVARREGYRLFMALHRGAPAGAMGWRLIHDLAFGRTFYIDDLIVDEAQRGTGIGRTLLDFARKRAVDEGCQSLRLTSGFRRVGAHGFYENAGLPKSGFTFTEPVAQD